jgi:hypothetical protein
MKKDKFLSIISTTILCPAIISVIFMLIAVILPAAYYHVFGIVLLSLGLLCGKVGILGGIIVLIVAALFTKKIDRFLFRVLAILFFGFVSVFILPRFDRFGIFSSKILQVGPDLRYLATALECYHDDNHKYPPWARGKGGVNGFAGKGTGAYKMHTFAKNTLTSPIKYIRSYPCDPFSDTKGATYGYYTDGGGFILYGWGTDTDENYPEGWDLEADVEKVYNSKIAQPSFTLLTGKSSAPKGGAYTYDPSNGAISEGDIYRVK